MKIIILLTNQLNILLNDKNMYQHENEALKKEISHLRNTQRDFIFKNNIPNESLNQNNYFKNEYFDSPILKEDNDRIESFKNKFSKQSDQTVKNPQIGFFISNGSANNKPLFLGPRGGVYYINGNLNLTYLSEHEKKNSIRFLN